MSRFVVFWSLLFSMVPVPLALAQAPPAEAPSASPVDPARTRRTRRRRPRPAPPPAPPVEAAAPAPEPAPPPAPPPPPEPPPPPAPPAASAAEVAALADKLAAAQSSIEELTGNLREMEDVVAELERKAALQRLDWSVDYRATLSSFRYHGESPDGARNPDGSPLIVDLRNLEQWTHRARLSLQADRGESLRFRGRITVFKRFGDISFSPVTDGTSSRVPRDATLRMDRFWLDWFITPSIGLSVGRISATDGSPAELRDNLPRPAATNAIGLIDREYDAAVLTLQRGPLTLRAIYASLQFQRGDDLYGLLPFLARNSSPLRVFAITSQLRFANPRLPAVDVTSYYIPRARALPPFELPAGGRLVSPTSLPTSLGSIWGVTGLVLARDAIPHLDVFFAASLVRLRPNGEAVQYPLGPGGESVPVFTLSSADSDDHLTYQLYGGARYSLPWGGQRAPKLGFEMTQGSRYLTNFATPTSDLVTRLGVRGRTYDAYLILPIYHEALFTRLSATVLDYSHAPAIGGTLGYSAALGGSAPPSERRVTALNLTMHATF